MPITLIQSSTGLIKWTFDGKKLILSHSLYVQCDEDSNLFVAYGFDDFHEIEELISESAHPLSTTLKIMVNEGKITRDESQYYLGIEK